MVCIYYFMVLKYKGVFKKDYLLVTFFLSNLFYKIVFLKMFIKFVLVIIIINFKKW